MAFESRYEASIPRRVAVLPRARKQEEQARNEGRTEQGSPVPEREVTNFEREMANARAGRRRVVRRRTVRHNAQG
ncbi:hypothetical protein PF001_g12587 [Phytophthora fragariae]|uniref:Uncharacterized protein n=1 Tax=Phytophthora fragariae TaxID=53985 RepID=A0A6A4DFN7_9STRA|nr:hypothetical protein PF001_g12587 [Phytophthora fragariae]